MNAPSRPPQTKKKWSTLKIVLVVIGSFMLLGTLVVAIGAYVVFSSPEGKKIAGIVGEAVKLGAKAQKAPGTKELRKMGCAQALVMDTESIEKMVVSYMDAGPQTKLELGEMVLCNVNLWSSPPSCDDIARTYVGAVGRRPRPFAATAQQAGKQKPSCSVLYDADGTRIRDFASGASIPAAPAGSAESDD